MDLFDSPPQTLLDDAEGGVRYWPSFAGAAISDDWLGALLGIEWEAHRRTMYDREVDVPRLTVAYSACDLPERLPLSNMLARVRAQVPAPFNSVGLNLYRDGSDSVAMHRDKLHSLEAGQPIALVSLGDARRMRIRVKADHRDAIDLPLAHGSLLVMSYVSQETHEHGIPKTARPVGPRISAVFRVRPVR